MRTQTWCPLCYGPLSQHSEHFKCGRCGSTFTEGGVIIQRGEQLQASSDDATEYKGVSNPAPVYDLRRASDVAKQRTDGSDWLDYAVTPTDQAQREAHFRNRGYMFHTLYATGDGDAPDSIKDRNGDVTLGLCRICGRGEADLIEPCTPKPVEMPGCTTKEQALAVAKNCTHRNCGNYMIRPCND